MTLATALGLLLGRSVTGPAVIALAVAGGLLCLLGAWTFRNTPWATALLIGLSLPVGLLAARLPIGAKPATWLGPAIAAGAGITAGAAVGRALQRFLGGLYSAIWLAAWIVVLATVAVQLVGTPGEWLETAAGAVLLVFLALAAAWFARLEPDPPPLAALDLYLIGLNLFLAASVLIGPAA